MIRASLCTTCTPSSCWQDPELQTLATANQATASFMKITKHTAHSETAKGTKENGGRGIAPLARLLWKSASIAANSGKSPTPGRGATLPASPICSVVGRVDKENAEGLGDSTKGPLRVPALEGFGLTSRLGLRSLLGGEALPLLGLLFLLDLQRSCLLNWLYSICLHAVETVKQKIKSRKDQA